MKLYRYLGVFEYFDEMDGRSDRHTNNLDVLQTYSKTKTPNIKGGEYLFVIGGRAYRQLERLIK